MTMSTKPKGWYVITTVWWPKNHVRPVEDWYELFHEGGEMVLADDEDGYHETLWGGPFDERCEAQEAMIEWLNDGSQSDDDE